MPAPSALYLSLALSIGGVPAAAQIAEPILTWSALPNPAGTVSVKFDFVSGLDQTGVNSQAIPETRLEIGLGRGFETLLQMPLLRVSEPNGSSVLAGGQFSMALRYLLAGSAAGKYAISVAGRLEVPTGDSAVVGNQTQLMPMLLGEWRAAHNLVFRSNLAWNTTVSGTTARFANFEYAHALVWSPGRRVRPVFEVAGSTNTLTGGTQLIVQPEVIVAPTRNLELKGGLWVATIPPAHYGIRAQLAWFWGRRE